ncbi:hypothetical protein AVEN_60688-1, partial [Araneus ventricosus]
MSHYHWNHNQNLQLADPEFHISKPINIILGADIFFELMQGNQIKGAKNTPYAIDTKLGWVLCGKVSSRQSQNQFVSHHTTSNINLENDIQNFWELKSLPQENSLSNEAKICEELYKSTLSRDDSGRYTVKLPFKPHHKLGNSKSTAVKCFYSLEHRLQKNPTLRQQYTSFLREYEELNHMELVPNNQSYLSESEAFYLPHHGVVREESISTKLRVVFNGSAKGSNSLSLNEDLYTGPKLQPDVFKILLNFRTFPIAISTDIEKMYRQIRIHSEDADFQRIIWRTDTNHPLSTYRLLTVTYGTSCAPYLAIRTLHQLAADEMSTSPEACKIIREHFYVDDLLTGANSVSHAKVLVSEINRVLQSGGFTLKKWASNIVDVLDSIPAESKLQKNEISIDESSSVKILGVHWNSHQDTLQIEITDPQEVLTKRQLLSVIARIFNPLGILSPTTIVLKILMQDLWKNQLSWDAGIPHEILKTWKTFESELSFLKDIRLPRFLKNVCSESVNVQLHGFCDASSKAYAAVIYIRVLTDTVISSISVLIHSTFLWSDSQIALCWISSPPSKGNQFVTHRVNQIHSLIPNGNRNYIPGKINQADCASRGLMPEKLSQHDFWWSGPQWLHDKHLPNFTANETPSHDNDETYLNDSLSFASQVKPIAEFITKFSSCSKLTRILAYCLRFVHNIRSPSKKCSGPLTAAELVVAENLIIQLLQEQEFSVEIRMLRENKPLPCNSKLLALNIFLEKSGIIRVCGRLSKHSTLNMNQKHPMLLPKDHHLTRSIIKEYHVRYLHAGPQLLLSLLRQKFWFSHGLSIVRQECHKCLTCRRAKSQSCQQLMSDLPSVRITPDRPFKKVGVDFCGPFLTKPNVIRSKVKFKSYVALFICMWSKAVHIELVSDLSTAAFLAALRRFLSRRGLQFDIYSDNGTNFKGAANHLRHLFNIAKGSEIQQFCTSNYIQWHFIPPYSPNHGGLWEASIKLAKHHLIRVCKSTILNFEEMTTLLCQIEACINSRPLTPLSSDPSDISALTPGHFLIGSSLLDLPEPTNAQPKLSLFVWQTIQDERKQFWSRWSREYLHHLQHRPKWASSKRDVQVDDLVLVQDPVSSPLHWILGRIVKTFPGQDARTRVVAVRTRDGEITRSISKISLILPGREDVQFPQEKSPKRPPPP